MKQIVFMIFIGIILNFSSCNSCEIWIQEHETNNSFSGFIEKIYIDTIFGRRNEPMMILDENGITNGYMVYNMHIYNLIDSGDFILKDSGSLKRYLIKGNDTIIYYPQCGDGNDIK